MPRSWTRMVLIPAFAAGFALAASFAIPVSADEDHHPKTRETRPDTPRGAMPGGGMMMSGMDGMMRMMRGMMSGMPDRGTADRRRMMGLGPTMMGGGSMMHPMRPHPIEHANGHLAFLKAELGITETQQKVWDDFAAALRANVEQINAWSSAQARDRRDDRSPLAALAHREASLTMQQ